jgi:hypothetical protein
MRKSLAVAFMLSLAAGASWAQEKGPSIIDEVGQLLMSDAQLAQRHRELAVQLQAYVAEGWREDLPKLAPPERGIGVGYGLDVKEEDDTRSIWAVRISQVYRDSAAGYAGILPGDWVIDVGGASLNSVALTYNNDAKIEVAEGRLSALRDRATDLFLNAPDPVVLKVERDGRALEFTVTRGPIAPVLRMAITREIPVLAEEFARLEPEMDQLVRDVNGSAPLRPGEGQQHDARIKEAVARIREVQDIVRILSQAAMVPPPEKPKPAAK